MTSGTVTLLLKATVATAVFIAITQACEPGYIAHYGSCYQFNSNHNNWDSARQACQQSGGDLAVIDSVLEADHVKSLRQTTGRDNTYYWIGARQQPHASSPFQWINGNSVISSLWSSGEPNQANGHSTQCIDLGVTSHQLNMNDYPCSASLPFMCEKKCPNGWIDNQYGTCYKFVHTSKSWSNARASCQQMGGNLAIVDTQAKADEMKLIRHNTGHQNGYYWIGASQETDAKGAFKWINDERFYNGLWFAGEPNEVDFVHRRCVDLGVGGQQWKMNDVPCTASLYYVCERAMPA